MKKRKRRRPIGDDEHRATGYDFKWSDANKPPVTFNRKECDRFVKESALRMAPTKVMRALDEGSKRILDQQAASISPPMRGVMRAGLLAAVALFFRESEERRATIILDGEEQPISPEEVQIVADNAFAKAFFELGSQIQRPGESPPVEGPLVTFKKPFKKGTGEVRKKRLAKKKRGSR